MAYIRTIPEAEATGELAEWYRRVGNPDGTVDNVMKVHSLNLATGRTHYELYRQACHLASPLSRAEREMIAVVVSRLNGCHYCLRHHHAGLRRLLPADRAPVADSLADGEPSGLTPRETAMVQWAVQLTTMPQEVTRQDTQSLRAAGLDDREILDLAQVIGYFNYVNRLVTGLGVELGDGEGAPGQWPAEQDA